MLKTRILQIIDRLDGDSPSQQLALLARRLPRDEFDVRVCTLCSGGRMANQLAADGIEVHWLKRRWTCDPFVLWRLQQLLRQWPPDIVQTWQFMGNSYGRMAARWQGVGCILAVQQQWERWKHWPHRWLDRQLAPGTTRFIVNSPALQVDFLEQGIPAQRIEVIASGIEGIAPLQQASGEPRSSSFARSQLLAELELPEDVRLLGAIGPLRPEQNFKDAIWSTDIAKILYDNVHLAIVGTGPCQQRLQRFAASIRIPQRVHFLGDRSDLAQLVTHFEMLLLPSAHEGQPQTALRAMLAGVPIVGTDTPAHRDLITDGVTGLLVPLGDRAAFAQAVHRLIEQPSLAQRLGQAARRHVLQAFPAELMVARYAALYRRCLASRS